MYHRIHTHFHSHRKHSFMCTQIPVCSEVRSQQEVLRVVRQLDVHNDFAVFCNSARRRRPSLTAAIVVLGEILQQRPELCACMCKYVYVQCSCLHVQVPLHAMSIYVRTFIHTLYTHTNMQTTHTRTRLHTHMHTHSHTHVRNHTYTHKTYTHTQPHMHTHKTYTHTQPHIPYTHKTCTLKTPCGERVPTFYKVGIVISLSLSKLE
jgi:hypothetical protein